MNDWILIVPMAAFALLAAAGWLVAYWAHRERGITRQVAKSLAGANKQLYAENADLREEVQERRAQVGNLTAKLDEIPATPKTRPVRMKTYGVPVKKVEDAP